jgi:hypothetical protein
MGAALHKVSTSALQEGKASGAFLLTLVEREPGKR